MNIIPAIDLYNGACVRLKQGEFEQVTEYSVDPLVYAKQLEAQGANTLHVVDLNGAKLGLPAQTDMILKIKQATTLTIQMGGGLRCQRDIVAALDAGVDRVVIGSLAVKNPQLLTDLMSTYSTDCFVLAFDVVGSDIPLVAVNGWQETSDWLLWDILDCYQDCLGIGILVTDISRDGMLEGPNFELYSNCLKQHPHFLFQASGGVGQLSDISKLNKLKMPAVIIGKALYENRFTLNDALREVALC